MSGRLIGPKSWDRSVEMFGARFGPSTTVWVICMISYALNYVLVCMRPEMAMDFGFTKWNRCRGLPTDSPLLGFGTVKNSPGLN